MLISGNSLASENILELGAGTALAAIVCLKKKAKVTVQELPDVLSHTLHCLKMNNVEATRVISCLWGETCVKEAILIQNDILMKTNNDIDDIEIDDNRNCNKINIENNNEIFNNNIAMELNIENEINTEINTEINCGNAAESKIQTEIGTKSLKKKRKKSFATKKIQKIEQNSIYDYNLKYEINEIKLFDRIIMADVLYHIEDFVPLISTIMNSISQKGIVVICYEQRRKNLNIFFNLIIPLFHSHEKHTIVIERKNDIDIDNDINDNNNNNSNPTTFQLHVLRSKISKS